MPCTPVGDVSDVAALAGDMLETMYAAPGRGLAAPQIGVLQRLFVMDVDWKDADRVPWVFINPEIVEHSEAVEIGTEGCLSIPGVDTVVTRPSWVRLRWTDLAGECQDQRFDGFAARCVQHEMDHLDGLVTFDRLGAQARLQAETAYAEASA